MTYLEFRNNVYSANGEDGIIKKLFSDLNITDGIVCEFGAANGLDDSNTAALWKQNYQAVLIESDSGRFDGLKNNTSEYDVECIHTMVRGGRKKGIKGASFNVEKDSNEYNDETWIKEREQEDAEPTIDNILEKSKFNITSDNFSLMSIDIDSYDYYVFNSIEKYFPKVLIFEVSSGYAFDEDYLNESKGCSIKTAYELGIEKGYKMICHCGNVIFVRNDLTHKLPDYDYSVENLYQGSYQFKNPT